MIPTNHGPMSPAQIVDALTYSCYRFNRQTMSAESLATLFPATGAAMEAHYQQEQRKAA